MDGAGLQDRYSRGLGAAARVFGMPHDLLRPCGPERPLLPERRLLRLPAAFDGGDPGYRRPRGYERALRGMFDADCTKVGDYLVGPRGVLFIVALPSMARPLCVLTTTTVSVLRAIGGEMPGLNGYGGVREPRLQTVLAGWPAELLGGTAGGREAVPDDPGGSRWTVLLPLTPRPIQASDLLQDATGQRYIVRVAEGSELGWRLSVRRGGV